MNVAAGLERAATPRKATCVGHALPFASTHAGQAVVAMVPLPIVVWLPGHVELRTAMRQARDRDREAVGTPGRPNWPAHRAVRSWASRFRRMQFGTFRTL